MLLRNFKQKAKKLYGKHNYVFRLCPLETQESLTDILHLACATKMPVNYYQYNFKNNSILPSFELTREFVFEQIIPSRGSFKKSPSWKISLSVTILSKHSVIKYMQNTLNRSVIQYMSN